MQVQQEFLVQRRVAEVVDLFQNVPAVVDCVPGASLLETLDDGSFLGQLTVKLGPITARFEGNATIVWTEGESRGSIDATGADRRGGSRAKMKVDFMIASDGEGTKVIIDADLVISGTAAQFARAGLVGELAARMIRDFAACLEAKLGASSPAEAGAVKAKELRALPLVGGAIVDSVRASLRKRR